jgi:predicted Abi (CAAX) family protease
MRPLHRTASSLLAGAASRLARAPRLRDWAEGLAGLAILAAAAAGLALWSDAVVFDPGLPGARAEPGRVVRVALLAFLVPAVGEEALFRGLLQPARLSGATATAGSAVSLLAFIAWHPLQVWLGLPSAQAVFLDPGFLALAGLLGLVCTVLVHRSGGVWTAVALHWIGVVAWKAREPFPAAPGAG